MDVNFRLFSLLALSSLEYEKELILAKNDDSIIRKANTKYEGLVLALLRSELDSDPFVRLDFEGELEKIAKDNFAFPLNLYIALYRSKEMVMPSDDEKRNFLQYYRILKMMINERVTAANAEL